MKTILLAFGLVLLCFFLCSDTQGDDLYLLDYATLNIAGGTSVGGDVTLNYSIEQFSGFVQQSGDNFNLISLKVTEEATDVAVWNIY